MRALQQPKDWYMHQTNRFDAACNPSIRNIDSTGMTKASFVFKATWAGHELLLWMDTIQSRKLIRFD